MIPLQHTLQAVRGFLIGPALAGGVVGAASPSKGVWRGPATPTNTTLSPHHTFPYTPISAATYLFINLLYFGIQVQYWQAHLQAWLQQAFHWRAWALVTDASSAVGFIA